MTPQVALKYKWVLGVIQHSVYNGGVISIWYGSIKDSKQDGKYIHEKRYWQFYFATDAMMENSVSFKHSLNIWYIGRPLMFFELNIYRLTIFLINLFLKVCKHQFLDNYNHILLGYKLITTCFLWSPLGFQWIPTLFFILEFWLKQRNNTVVRAQTWDWDKFKTFRSHVSLEVKISANWNIKSSTIMSSLSLKIPFKGFKCAFEWTIWILWLKFP